MIVVHRFVSASGMKTKAKAKGGRGGKNLKGTAMGRENKHVDYIERKVFDKSFDEGAAQEVRDRISEMKHSREIMHALIDTGMKTKEKARGGLKGKDLIAAAMGRGIAHLKYIVHRPGEDREEGGRKVFNESSDEVKAKEVRELIRELKHARVLMHTLILSPQIQLENKKELTREVMKKFSDLKGQDLEWVAVEHNNTEHYHVHVIVFGKDKQGKGVAIKKEDYAKLREFGDQFLERVHPLELAYERERKEKETARIAKEVENARQLAKFERMKEGLELPWLHQKIMREQYEPYAKWKEKQKVKQKQSERTKNDRAVRATKKDRIRALAKEWTKANSLKELRELNEHLWDNYGDRIDKASYNKLVLWIRQKENEERFGSGSKKHAGKDYLEYDGKIYTENSSFTELGELSRKVHKAGAQRLPFEDYQRLRAWKESAERASFHDALNRQIEYAKQKALNAEAKIKNARNILDELSGVDKKNGRSPGSTVGSGAAAAYSALKAAGEFATSMVSIFSLGMETHPDPTDRRQEETIYQPDMHRQLKWQG